MQWRVSLEQKERARGRNVEPNNHWWNFFTKQIFFLSRAIKLVTQQ
jgi:hypothetical protein